MFTPPPSPRPPRHAMSRSPLSSPLASPLPSPIPSPSPSPRMPARYLSPNPDVLNDLPPLFSPSPSSSKSNSSSKSTIPPLPLPSPSSDSQMQLKRRIGRRLKWAAIVVPLALVFITASMKLLAPSHPRFPVFSSLLDVFSSPSYSYSYVKSSCRLQVPPSLQSASLTEQGASLSIPSPSDDSSKHAKRQQNPSSASSPVAFPSSPATPTSSAPSSSVATTAATAQPLPTAPSSPPTDPPVPTPFPQPFDSDLSTNFSTVGCYNFFQKMLNMVEFRSCRSFGMLLQSSDQFLKAQNNLTLLNTLVWGTCNTNTSAAQCETTMSGFAQSLKQECAQDLKDGNARAVNTLNTLSAYTLMRNAGCQVDPSTNTYCFVNAVHNTNPSDLYFYQLAFGTSFPRGSNPTCSACTRSLMNLYADGLQKDARNLGGNSNGSGGNKVLTGLRKTYDAAAKRAVDECGVGYATLNVVSSGGVITLADVRVVAAAALVVAVSLVVGGMF